MAFHAAAFSNPLGWLFLAMEGLAIAYGLSKIEEDEQTRQPIIYYPLTQHGKPYVGGMSGALRSSKWDSLFTEAYKTINTLKRTATVVDATRRAFGLGSSFLVDMLSEYSDASQARRITFRSNPDDSKDANKAAVNEYTGRS